MSASDERLYFLLQTAAQRIKKRADSDFVKSAGLTTAQAGVLTIIIDQEGTNHTYLARTLRQQKSAITTMAERLEKAGYITKKKSDSDKRSWELKVTKSGLEACQRMRKPADRLNAIVDEVLKEKRVSALANDLRKLIKVFE